MPPAGAHPQAHPHVINPQQIQQQREIQMQHQMAQRRSRKPTDLNMPEGLEDINPFIAEYMGQYKELQEGERKLDMITARKRLDMQDRYNRPERREGVLRIWIWNTVENQPWQQNLDPDSFDFDTGLDPTYKLTIMAKLLPEDDEDSDEEEDKETKVVEDEDEVQKDKKRFSNFFNRISIDVERPTGEPVNLVDWKKQQNSPSFDHINMQRKGDENFNLVISLTREEKPERFRLSQALTSTLDMEEGSRAEVLQCLWEYIKLFGLQDDDEKRRVRCDSNLKAIFGVDIVYFPQIPERIIQHLHPLPPYQLRYTVHMDKEYNGAQTIYDVRVAVEDPICARIYAMTHSPKHHERLQQIAGLDDQLAVLIQQLHHHMARHAFFKGFAMDPVNFCKKWLASQQRDLEIILGERGEMSGSMEFEKGGAEGVWGSDAVRAAVQDMLNKPKK
jgi:SWI/SNF-related matrix-associated actin-dependent regulator of chromatin subfamily D